jgi:hypothetical protein
VAVDVPDWTFSTVALGEVVSLASFVAVGGETQIDFSFISAGYSLLELRYQIRGSQAVASDTFKVHLNNDLVDTNYESNYWRSVTAASPLTTLQNGPFQFEYPCANVLAGLTGFGVLRFPRYADSHFLKVMEFSHQDDEGATFTTGPTHIEHGWTVWNNTVAVNEITINPASSSLAAGSWALLLGYQ